MRMNRSDRAEQPQHLIDHMAAKIAQQSTLGSVFQRCGIVLFHPRLNAPDPAQPPAVQHLFQRAHIRVTAPVVKNAQRDAPGLCGGL